MKLLNSKSLGFMVILILIVLAIFSKPLLRMILRDTDPSYQLQVAWQKRDSIYIYKAISKLEAMNFPNIVDATTRLSEETNFIYADYLGQKINWDSIPVKNKIALKRNIVNVWEAYAKSPYFLSKSKIVLNFNDSNYLDNEFPKDLLDSIKKGTVYDHHQN